MKLGYYYHTEIFEDNGNLHIHGYQGVFLDSLAQSVDELLLFMHSAPNEALLPDYQLESNNIRWINLGKKPPAWKRVFFAKTLLRKFRQEIINEKLGKNLQKVFNTSDFYSLSMARDLFFHVQELRFTIPQISKIIKDFNLEFLGFYIKDSYKRKFSRMFPEDIKNLSLDNWNQFEKDNPDIFFNMYQFWMRKK